MLEFPTPDALADALATDVATTLRNRIFQRGTATLAVSGGTTPAKFLTALSLQILAWAQVTITLVDDRCVPATSPRSNARLIRGTLLQNAAATATFLPLTLTTPIADLAPFTAVILGMGLDGHTASLFPGGDHLAAALTGPHLIETMTAPNAPEPRLTLTLPTLLNAEFLAIHIEGAAKRTALETAQTPGEVKTMPIRAVLARQPPPQIYWCP